MAVGTELLLGQIADTNSQWLGEHLAALGVASHFHQAVGDNHERIVLAFRTALARSDGVIVCGGLGPTHDDITRDAIAEVMNVPLLRDEQSSNGSGPCSRAGAGRCPTPTSDRPTCPKGRTIIPQTKGTAPGLICPVGHKVVYAVPGVPYEMSDMFERAIAPDLQRRMAERGELAGTIVSRVIRTWGMSESGLAEVLAGYIDWLDDQAAAAARAARPPSPSWPAASRASRSGSPCVPTSGCGRCPARRTKRPVARVLAEAAGDVVFGIDDEAIEDAVARALATEGLTLGLAESLTGGLAASRLVNVPGASAWFRGSVVSYASEVKFDCTRRPRGAGGVRGGGKSPWPREPAGCWGPTWGCPSPGSPDPTEQDGRPPGTVFVGLARPGHGPRGVRVQRAGGPGPGTPVRHHRRARPVAAGGGDL